MSQTTILIVIVPQKYSKAGHVVWQYRKISVFSHHASVFRMGKNPITPVLFAQSVMFSVLIGQFTHVLLSNRWRQYELIAVRALLLDSPLLTTVCLQVTPSVGSSWSWDEPVYSAAPFPATVSNPNLKERGQQTKQNAIQSKTGRQLVKSLAKLPTAALI